MAASWSIQRLWGSYLAGYFYCHPIPVRQTSWQLGMMYVGWLVGLPPECHHPPFFLFLPRIALEFQQDRWIRTRFRLLASIPPIIFGILERELGTITDYAGTTGLVIGFSFPALLYVRSRALAERKHFSTSTYYSAYSSSKILGWFLFAFGLMMVAYVVYFLIEEENADHKSRKQE